MSSMETLFPILTLFFLAALFVIFLIFNKTTEKKKNPRKTVPAEPPKAQGPIAPANIIENFQASSDTVRVYPTWTNPSIIFPVTSLDSFYVEYANTYLQPNADLLAQIDALPPGTKKDGPKPGSLLDNFDASISTIPWDADNKGTAKTDVVWGIISREVSKSIFLKGYHRTVLSDPNFIRAQDNLSAALGVQYSSIFLDIGTNDPGIGALYQTFDAAIQAVGQSLRTEIQESFNKILGAEKTVRELLEAGKAERANTARLTKLASGIALNAAEKEAHEAFAAKKSTLTLFEKVAKNIEKWGIGTKLKLGFGKAKEAVKAAGAAIKKLATAVINKLIPKILTGAAASFAASTAVQIGVNAANVAASGAFSVIAAIVTAACTVIQTMDEVSSALAGALAPIIAVIFEKSFENGSVCKQGKSLDMLIPNQTALMFFSMFVPFGTVVETLGPYLCTDDHGTLTVKSPFVLPDYFYDTTLSLYRHHYKPGTEASPLVTSIVSNTTNLDKSWKEKAGIYRQDCSGGTYATSEVDALCNISTYCPKVNPKKSGVPLWHGKQTSIPSTTGKRTHITTYSKPGGYSGSCRPGDGDWVVLPLCTAPNCSSFGPDYDFVAGICWGKCSSNQVDVWALCRDNCPAGYRDVAGVCWKDCTSDQVDIGAICTDKCGVGNLADTPHNVAGICWSDCAPNEQDMGALCRETCREGFHDVGCCWGNTGTYPRPMLIPTAMAVSSGGWDPPNDIPSLLKHYTDLTPDSPLYYCDYSSPIMLDRMGQFYYNQSILNPQKLEDGRISYEYFIMFYCVISSSELSCDVGGCMRTVTFDPVTGGNYEEKYGTYYQEDPGNTVSYRRFYFMRMERNTNIATISPSSGTVNLKITRGPPLKAGDPVDVSDSTNKANKFTGVVKSIDAAKNVVINTIANISGTFTAATSYIIGDGQGTFSVTGCTNTDYTAPDAHVHSTDEGVDPPISLPKIFKSINRTIYPGQGIDPAAMGGAIASSGTSLALGYIGGSIGGRAGASGSLTSAVGGAVGGIAGGIAGGFAGQGVTELVAKLSTAAVPLGQQVENSIAKDSNGNYYVASESDNWSINFGPIYESVANQKIGYVPDLNFCNNVNTTELLCSHQFVLRDTILAYQAANPNIHVKTLYTVEPRGTDGCYYKWSTTSYNPATNAEGTYTNVEEVVRQYVINDKSTCVWAPTNNFIKDMTNYPVRQYYDTTTNTMVYPTKITSYTSNYSGRWIKILPSQTASDSFLELSQVAVYDPTGKNIALNKPCYSTSKFGVSAPVNIITNGNLAAISGAANVYTSAGNASDYIMIDLGQNINVYSIEYYGRNDSPNTSRNKDVRFQLLYSSSDTKPVKELTTIDATPVQSVKFTTPVLTNAIPSSPFSIPQSLPLETNLNSCAARCSDRPVIDSLVKQYNSTNIDTQIINVLRAVTPFSNRCDYEIEIKRNVGLKTATGTKTTIAKEIITMTTAMASTSPTNGTVYGRYVRLRPSSNYLCVSQIIVSSASVANLALKKSVYATSSFYDPVSNTRSTPPSVITDGVTDTRSMPNVWKSGYMGVSPSASFITQYNANEYIDVDLGQSYPITSISYYGGSDTFNTVRVQILAVNDSAAIPIYETTISNRASGFSFPQCSFTLQSYSLNPPSSFIQENTPYLSSSDTTGGVLTFQSVGTSIMNYVNSIINPIQQTNPLGALAKNVSGAQTTLTNTFNSIASSQILSGCPTTKCSDPAVLDAIANAYNTASFSSDGIGAESRVMVQVAKAGVSSPNTCDILFKELYNYYDDYLYKPVETNKGLVAKRFTMVNTGSCNMQVAPGSAIVDISSNAIGIMAGVGMTYPYPINTCQVNCRDTTVVGNVKKMLETQLQTPTSLPVFRAVTQSFSPSGSTCEYMMSKDVTKKDTVTDSFSVSPGVYTYVKATFTANKTCAFTLSSVTEYDPDSITTQPNPTTSLLDTFLNGAKVQLPYLFSYDNTTPSDRVNETVQIL